LPVHPLPPCCDVLLEQKASFISACVSLLIKKVNAFAPEVTVTNRLACISIALCALSSAPALADGFSLTLDAPVLPQFSIGLGLNYSLQVIPNLYVGISTDTRYTASAPADAQFSFDARFGGKYIAGLYEETSFYIKWYAGTGVTIRPIGVGSGVKVDFNGGLFGRYELSRVAKIYGGVDGGVFLDFNQASPLNLYASAFAGVKIDPNPLLSAYFQVAGGWNRIENTGTQNPGYLLDARIGGYIAIVPQFRIGLFVGYLASASGGGVIFGIGGQFLERPGTLATPGNYLP
jgi:hypothetical protein